MDLYSEIERRGLVSPTFSALILGDPDDYEAPVLQTLSLPKLMHDICVFYATLVQMRLGNRAVSESRKVYEYCNGGTERMLRGMWSEDKTDITYEMAVYSFLGDCARGGMDPEAFGNNVAVILRAVGDQYDRFMKRGSTWNVEEYKTTFLELLEALPLVRTLEIDVERHVLRFGEGDWMDFAPFLFIKDGRLFFMTSVCRGEQNNQLKLRLYEFNCPDEEPVEESVRITVYNNEYLTLLCDAFDLKTIWYQQEEYLGNCTFVVRLSEILATAVQRDIEEEVGIPKNIIPHLREYFYGSEILDLIDKINYNIDGNGVSGSNNYALQNVFMGFIITTGAFVTTHDLLYVGHHIPNVSGIAVPDEQQIQVGLSSTHLFEKIIDVIRERGYAKADIESRVSQCYDQIRLHLSQLERIVPQDTLAFRIRADHIHAEQMAGCILQLIGVEKDNLFANQEVMLSINDYFDMVNNKNANLSELIRNIVSFLLKFYSKISGVTAEVPEGASPSESLTVFRDYCESVRGNEAIISAIGRDICDVGILRNYITNFSHIDDWSGDGVANISRDYLMVSYSHADYDVVKSTVMRLRSKGYNVHMDEEQFQSGDNWKRRFTNEIIDENCVGVLAFVSRRSVVSGAISFELEAAERVAKGRGMTMDDIDRFTIPINLESEAISEWLGEMLFSGKSETDKTWEYATSCKERLDNNKIFINSGPGLDEEVEAAVSSRIKKRRMAIDFNTMNDAELATDSFLAFLKTGDYYWFSQRDCKDDLGRIISETDSNESHCIYPQLVSVKETRIKRDSITILGYEVINGKGRTNPGSAGRVMLSSSSIKADDYYCIPNVRSSGECGEWMANPLLISFDDMRGIK